MSDSDSQSNKSFNMGSIPQQNKSHVKQILQKGRKIVPSYDQSTLYSLYKRYYSVDHIFYNELNIIARRMTGLYDDQKKNHTQWVTVGRKIRTKVNKSKYNFLEDKQLIRRAEKYIQNQFYVPERRQYNNQYQNKDNQKNYHQNRNQNQNQNYKQRNIKKYQEKINKNKFVQKIQDKDKIINKQQQNKQNPEKYIKQQIQHKQQNQSKQQIQPKQTNNQQQQQTQPKQQIQPKQTNNQQQQNNNNKNKYVEKDMPKKQEQKTTVVVDLKKTQPNTILKKQEPGVLPVNKKTQTKQKETQAPKQQHKKEPITTPTPVAQKSEPVKIAVVQKTQTQQQKKPVPQTPATISSSAKIIIDQSYDPVLAAKNFDEASKQNSFILGFIRPQPYPQRISYTRTSNGDIKDVKIRVTGTANSN